MKENVAVINQINELGSQTASAAERHALAQTGRGTENWPPLGTCIRLSFKNIWIVITPCFLTLQQLAAPVPAAACTRTLRILYAHKNLLTSCLNPSVSRPLPFYPHLHALKLPELPAREQQ